MALGAALLVGACGRETPTRPEALPPRLGTATAPARHAAPVDVPPEQPCVAAHDSTCPGDADDWPAPASARGVLSGTLVDAAGARAPNVELRFWSNAHVAGAYSTPDGTFGVGLVSGIDYDVDAFLGAPWHEWRRGRRVHVGTVRAEQKIVTLGLPEAQTVLASGVLVDKHGTPMSGWDIDVGRVDDAGNVSPLPSVTTDADGRYRVVSWRVGRIRCDVARRDGWRTWRISAANADQTTGESRLTARSAITGRVVVDDGGTPAGTTVRLWRGDGILDRSVTVDGSGAFDFDDTVPDWQYEIGAELPGYDAIEHRQCAYDSLDVQLELVGTGQRIDGRLLDGAGEPAASAWVRFVPADGRGPVQSMTDADGNFRTIEARGVEYEAFVLVTGNDGRLVPGAMLGRCRGGDRSVVLRAPR